MLTSAEGYLNRYRNGWGASSAATKAWVEEMVRRRGKPLGGQAPVPLVDLPVPVPISRFLWPFVSLSSFSVAVGPASVLKQSPRHCSSCCNWPGEHHTQDECMAC